MSMTYDERLEQELDRLCDAITKPDVAKMLRLMAPIIEEIWQIAWADGWKEGRLYEQMAPKDEQAPATE